MHDHYPRRLAAAFALVAAVAGVGLYFAPAYAQNLTDAMITLKVMSPLKSNPVRKTGSVGTTIDDLIDTDIAAPHKDNRDSVQLFVVSNKHASQYLCVDTVAWSGADSCATRCATLSTTCSGSSTDGSLILPSTQREFRFDGTRCACVIGSAASTTFQAERITR